MLDSLKARGMGHPIQVPLLHHQREAEKTKRMRARYTLEFKQEAARSGSSQFASCALRWGSHASPASLGSVPLSRRRKSLQGEVRFPRALEVLARPSVVHVGIPSHQEFGISRILKGDRLPKQRVPTLKFSDRLTGHDPSDGLGNPITASL